MDITGLGAVFDFGGKLLDKLFPDPEQRAQAQIKLLEMQQSGELAKLTMETDLLKGQLEINKIEAASENAYISGARPFFIWVCGFGFAYSYVLQPFMIFLAILAKPDFDYHKLPELDWANMLAIAAPLLGIGGMKTYEKIKGK